MKWITRERPKIDRLACPWLIKKFIDFEAEFLFVPENEVLAKSYELNAIPFDIPNVEYSHYDDKVTFDYFIKKHKLQDKGLDKLALIVRAADTDQHHLSNEAAGLWAISWGLCNNIKNDYDLLKIGFIIYDALYAWSIQSKKIKHLENSPFEKSLNDIVITFKNEFYYPKWVNYIKQLEEYNPYDLFKLNLKKIASINNLNASFLSREFPKYFDNLTFKNYIVHIKIKAAINLLKNTNMSLTDIAFKLGFADQSHFTRVFKKNTHTKPRDFRIKVTKV